MLDVKIKRRDDHDHVFIQADVIEIPITIEDLEEWFDILYYSSDPNVEKILNKIQEALDAREVCSSRDMVPSSMMRKFAIASARAAQRDTIDRCVQLVRSNLEHVDVCTDVVVAELENSIRALLETK